MKTLTIFIFTIFIFTNCFADEWYHINRYQGDYKISIDYLKSNLVHPPGCYKCSKNATADELYVNVKGSNLFGNKKIRVVITNMLDHSYTNYVNKESYVLDLYEQSEGHYSNKFSNAKKLFKNREIPLEKENLIIYSTGYVGTFNYYQEIAVVVDGTWLDNFNVNLWQNQE